MYAGPGCSAPVRKLPKVISVVGKGYEVAAAELVDIWLGPIQQNEHIQAFISGCSCRTAFNNEVCTAMWPL